MECRDTFLKKWVKPSIEKIEIVKVTAGGSSGNVEQHIHQTHLKG